MKNHLCNMMMAAALMCATQSLAQTATDPGEGLRASVGSTSGTTAISWWGKAGRTYFVQTCVTLMEADWRYVPVIESGSGAVITWNLSSSAERGFVRLVYTDQAYTGPVGDADFDNDGISNLAEATANSIPTDADSDDDGFDDGTEANEGTDARSGGDYPGMPTAAVPPITTPQPVQEALYVVYNYKEVYNYWERVTNGTTVTESGILEWEDHQGQDDETYQVFEPRWEPKFSSLQLPTTGRMGSNWSVHGSSHHQITPLPSGQSNGTESQSVRIRDTLAGMGTFPATPARIQAWPVVVRALRWSQSHTLTGNTNSIPNVEVTTFTIPQGSADSSRISLSTVKEVGIEKKDYLSRIPVNVWSPNEIARDDLTSAEDGSAPWVSMPQYEPRSMHISGAGGTFSYMATKAEGGGLTPVTQTTSSQTLTSGSVGDSGVLKLGMTTPQQTPGVFATEPAARFTVYSQKILHVHVNPIIRTNSFGATLGTPENIPTAQQLRDYLDSVFDVQANIHCVVTVNAPTKVFYDIGLGLPGAERRGAGNNQLDIEFGVETRRNFESLEEAAIITAAQGKYPSSGINVFLVASNLLAVHAWQSKAAEGEVPLDAAKCPPIDVLYRGWAAYPHNANPRHVWVAAIPGNNQANLDRTLDIMAHEVGHALGLAHSNTNVHWIPQQPNQAFLLRSDPQVRLMKPVHLDATSGAGQRYPKRLIKWEWDTIRSQGAIVPDL